MPPRFADTPAGVALRQTELRNLYTMCVAYAIQPSWNALVCKYHVIIFTRDLQRLWSEAQEVQAKGRHDAAYARFKVLSERYPVPEAR